MQNAWGLARHEAGHFCLILLWSVCSAWYFLDLRRVFAHVQLEKPNMLCKHVKPHR